MNRTSPSSRVDSTAARSPERSIAGLLVMRSGAASSAAMIIAIVALPEPGRPRQQHAVVGRTCRAARRALQHAAEVDARDLLLADEVVEPAWPQRALDHPLDRCRLRRDNAVGGVAADVAADVSVVVPGPAAAPELGFLGPGGGVASVRHVRRATASAARPPDAAVATSGVWSPGVGPSTRGRDRVASLRADHLCLTSASTAPWSRQVVCYAASAGGPGSAVAAQLAGAAEAVLELEDDPLLRPGWR